VRRTGRERERGGKRVGEGGRGKSHRGERATEKERGRDREGRPDTQLNWIKLTLTGVITPLPCIT
jgi:hypothetical protein